jgi:uncharacterized membrane protein
MLPVSRGSMGSWKSKKVKSKMAKAMKLKNKLRHPEIELPLTVLITLLAMKKFAIHGELEKIVQNTGLCAVHEGL